LNHWVVNDYFRLVDSVNTFEPRIHALSDEQLDAKIEEFRLRLAQGDTLANIQVEAFAVVREAAIRKLGMLHFDVQIIGGVVLHEGTTSTHPNSFFIRPSHSSTRPRRRFAPVSVAVTSIKEKLSLIHKTFTDFTSLNHWVVNDYFCLVDSVNAFEPRIHALSNEQLAAKTEEFRLRLAQGETLADIQDEAFAVV
ncbi:hypothetical protein RYX36_005485, partial [Vicia faba]